MRAVTGGRRRGTTLAEVVVAAALAGVVAAGLFAALVAGQRFSRSQPQILDVQRNLRAAAQLLSNELRGLDAADGDLLAATDTSVTLLAGRGLGVVCAVPDVGALRVTVSARLSFGLRAVDPARDSVLLYRDADDRWLRARVAVVGAGSCSDGSPGTRLTLALTGGGAELDGVSIGAPYFAVEVVRYRLYEDASHVWWLGVQTYSGGWSVTSPVAGPLRARDGLRFSYLDVAGASTTDRAAVRAIAVTLRGRSVRAVAAAGRRPGPFEDSITVGVALRNGADD